MLSAAQVPWDDRYKLWGENIMTVTALDNITPVTLNGVTKTRYEHAGRMITIPEFVKYHLAKLELSRT